MKFTDFITKSTIVRELKSVDKKGAIQEMVESARSAYKSEGIKIKETVDELMKREKIGTTGIGGGIAVPHAKLDGIKSVLGVFGRSARGVDFAAIDGASVSLIFLLLTPKNNPDANLQALQRVSQATKLPNFAKFLKSAKDAKDIMSLFQEFDEVLK